MSRPIILSSNPETVVGTQGKNKVLSKVIHFVVFCCPVSQISLLKFSKVQLWKERLQRFNAFLKQILWSYQLHWNLIDFCHLKSWCDKSLNAKNHSPCLEKKVKSIVTSQNWVWISVPLQASSTITLCVSATWEISAVGAGNGLLSKITVS